MWIVSSCRVSSRTMTYLAIFQVIFSVLYSLLVVEFDLPWDDSQVAQYGDSFKAWSAEEFKPALNAVLQTMPYNAIAIVVPLLFRL